MIDLSSDTATNHPRACAPRWPAPRWATSSDARTRRSTCLAGSRRGVDRQGGGVVPALGDDVQRDCAGGALPARRFRHSRQVRHIATAEGGGSAFIAQVMLKPVIGERGVFCPEQIRAELTVRRDAYVPDAPDLGREHDQSRRWQGLAAGGAGGGRARWRTRRARSCTWMARA